MQLLKRIIESADLIVSCDAQVMTMAFLMAT